jgi:alpha-mannosidase
VPRIEIRTTVDNHARDHRLRVHFPTPIQTDHSVAESIFDVVERPIVLPNATPDWAEQPVGTHPQRTFVDVSDGTLGLMVANRGLPEYEVLPGAEGVTVALTLLRCVGWLSRDDFPCRRGQAGPLMPAPEAQCLGQHTFEYALIPHAGDWRSAFQQAHAFSVPLRAVPTDAHPGTLSLTGALLEVEPAEFVITAIRQAEDGIVVRGYNIAPHPIQARVRLNSPAREVTRTNLAEEPLEPLSRDAEGWVHLALRAREIATLKFT